MAQQDVRYYLNGLLLETGEKMLRAVATDGHRLALCERRSLAPKAARITAQQVIVPRKGVQELQRLLAGEGDVGPGDRFAITFEPRSATFASLRS